MSAPIASPLGKKVTYIAQYQPDLLFSIPRNIHRQEIGIKKQIPFKGCDIWNAYEMSWLNEKGKPVVAVAEFIFPCESPALIESKSFKLYLNSFNNTSFVSLDAVKTTLIRDLSEAAEAKVKVHLYPLEKFSHERLHAFAGFSLDQLDVECTVYQCEPTFLVTEDEVVSEIVYSDLLKSNCLVTGQPDWASVQIKYSGKKINREGLLKYIVSFRDHNEFHEQCVERIFMDIMTHCHPEQLTVYARYTRRGGLDINPFRSTENGLPENSRLVRQ